MIDGVGAVDRRPPDGMGGVGAVALWLGVALSAGAALGLDTALSAGVTLGLGTVPSVEAR